MMAAIVKGLKKEHAKREQLNMIRFNAPIKITFISSCPSSTCPIAICTSHIVENMIPASYGAFEPVMIAVKPDISREYSDTVDFVIRRDFRSDYMEAADFINAGNGDVVMLQHHFDIFGVDGASNVVDLLKRIEVPVITTLYEVPENPPTTYLQSLVDVCDISQKIIVMNGNDLEVLHKQYDASLNKIDQIIRVCSDSPFGQQMRWFNVGRQYWQCVSDLMDQSLRRSQIPQEAREHSIVFR